MCGLPPLMFSMDGFTNPHGPLRFQRCRNGTDQWGINKLNMDSVDFWFEFPAGIDWCGPGVRVCGLPGARHGWG